MQGRIVIAPLAAVDTSVPTRCHECGADQFGCQTKAGLSGRRCCDSCTHVDRDNR